MSDLQFKILSSKAENNFLIIEGIASNSSIDRQGEKIIITPEALDKAIPIFLNSEPTQNLIRSNNLNGTQNTSLTKCPNNGYMKYHHGGIDKDFHRVGATSIGKVLEMNYNKTNDLDVEILAKCEITNPMVINLINQGYARNFSLNWFWLVRTIDNTKGCFIDTDIAIHELSVTPNPVNKQAVFEVVTTPTKYSIGQKVLADQMPMAVKAVMGYQDQILYELEPLIGSFKSDLVFPEQSIKAFITNFDDNSLDKIIKKILLDKIKSEGYDIPTQRVTNFNYELTGQLTFGQDSNYKTSINLHSNGKAEIIKPILGASKIIESSKAEEIKDPEIKDTKITSKILKIAK